MFGLKIYAILAMSRQTVYILFISLSLIGIVALFLTVREIIRTIKFLRAARQTDGTVIRFEPWRNAEGTTKHLAVVRFKTHDKRIREIRAGVAHTPPAPEIGTKVTVCYLTGFPEKAKIKSFWELWESSLFYFVFFFSMLFFVSILSAGL